GDGDAASFSQTQMDEVVTKRLARERVQRDAEEKKRLEALGYDSWDALSASHHERQEAAAQKKREAEEAERAKLEREQKFDELLALERKKREEEAAKFHADLEAARAENTALQQRQRAAEIQRALVGAASAAVAPEQVAQLLTGQLGHDAEGRLVVLDAQGQPRTDGQGGDFTPAQLVSEFLEVNPHFARAASGRGAGSSAPGTPTGGADGYEGLPPHRRNDVEYMLKHAARIQADMKAGRLTG
ncbi:MAG: hypothetical protein AAGI01_15710, partial [Myxococcota bacterium]